MKKLILGLCISFGALYSAEDSMCIYNTKMLLESNEKSQKAFKLDLMAETQRYINETRYYTKQVLISCDEKGEIYKVAKELLDSYRKIDKESGN